MATINIKGRADPIIVSSERARIVKKNWCGDNPVPRDQILDLGEWAGEYGQIKSVELEKLIKYDSPEFEEKLTPEQIREGQKTRSETRRWLEERGIINKK